MAAHGRNLVSNLLLLRGNNIDFDFKSCPLDWPLLNVQWKDSFYLDVTMPFGARAISSHMQRVADAIVKILKEQNILAYMYLDDLIVILGSKQQAEQDLGLPEAYKKSQPPAQMVRWLGVNIDVENGTLSIPNEKLADIVKLTDMFVARRASLYCSLYWERCCM